MEIARDYSNSDRPGSCSEIGAPLLAEPPADARLSFSGFCEVIFVGCALWLKLGEDLVGGSDHIGSVGPGNGLSVTFVMGSLLQLLSWRRASLNRARRWRSR